AARKTARDTPNLGGEFYTVAASPRCWFKSFVFLSTKKGGFCEKTSRGTRNPAVSCSDNKHICANNERYPGRNCIRRQWRFDSRCDYYSNEYANRNRYHGRQ